MNPQPKFLAYLAYLAILPLIFPVFSEARPWSNSPCSQQNDQNQFQSFHRSQHFQPRQPQQAPHAMRGCGCHGGMAIRLVAGHQRGKTKRPQGWHAKEWYLRRGYNLDNYAHQHRDGTVHYGQNMRRR